MFEIEPPEGYDDELRAIPCVAPSDTDQRILAGGLEVDDSSRDLGVTFESTKAYSELAKVLGLDEDGRLLIFNKVRHSGGLTPWTKTGNRAFKEYANEDGPSQFKPLRLHWHQLSGMSAALRKLFREQAVKDPIPGVLIADQVGLGKTFLAIAILGLLIQLGTSKSLSHKNLIPPIIQALPFLGPSSDIPDMPSLIIVPGTLNRQWLGELYTLFVLFSVDIFIYPSSKAARLKFFGKDSAWARSEQRMRNRIIVVTHSTLLQEFSMLWETKKEKRLKGLAPWSHPEKREDFDVDVKKTLYGFKYLTVIFDEAQSSRNYGSKHSAALLILDRCLVRLVLTATPLQTRTEDISAMGHLVGIPYFSSEDYLAHQIKYLADARRARVDKDKGEWDGVNCPVQALQLAETAHLRDKFDNRVIRRTRDSLDNLGSPLLSLPPCFFHDIVVNLQDWEREFVDASIPEATLQSLAQASASGLSTMNFYVDERMDVVFPNRLPPIARPS
ncbi:P-loop containing nucleoside triphosphate hydrolase protein [Coprinopsis sp. MPI-PUGE-AT-0042]|nr:P-loop containing nucleoside triphosphate hydrolase protein [Coprinopsis sp. MPI-PUGE-AT-0042]